MKNKITSIALVQATANMNAQPHRRLIVKRPHIGQYVIVQKLAAVSTHRVKNTAIYLAMPLDDRERDAHANCRECGAPSRCSLQTPYFSTAS